jgi:hypothetical protein
VTQDGGKTWNNVTPAGLPAFARISVIEASPHNPGTAYVAANRYQRDDRAPYVYRTDDVGKTWTKIVAGVPENDFARSIREDIKKPGLLYLGTEHGIYVSFDNGANWQSLRLDLPVTPVHGIVSTENDLVIGTHGRSFYILDNAAILRQLTPVVAGATVHVFDPPAAIRGISRGVSIDYLLKSAADKVTMEILDDQGQAINVYSGAAEKDAAKPEAARGEDEEGVRRQPPRVATKAGMNRFVWDMRYANAADFPGMILWAGSTRGPVARPGRYQVRLTAGGETKSAGFTIRKNPNLTAVSDGDLQEQFTLAMQIRDRVTQANEAVIRIRDLKKQIADRVSAVRSKEKGQQSSDAVIGGEAVALRLTMVEGEIYQYRNQSSQDPLNFPIKLNNKLAALQGVVESGDGKPTDQSYAVFKDLSDRLDEQLAKLAAVVKTNVAAFNKSIQQKKLEAVK